jgi:hypothetical protein
MHQSAVDEVLNQPLSQELLARDLTRLAFIALDGTLPTAIEELMRQQEERQRS